MSDQDPTTTTSVEKRPWYKKKRFIIPAGIFALLLLIGLLLPPEEEKTPVAASGDTPTTTTDATTTTAEATTTTQAPTTTEAPTTTVAPTTTTAAPPQPVVYEGAGDMVQEISRPYAATEVAVYAEHSGSRNFAVVALDAALENQDLLVNTIGNYEGTRLIGVDGEETSFLEITADGAWRIEIQPIFGPGVPQFDSELAGSGDAVAFFTGETAVVTLTHDGERNFAVQSYGERSDLLVNEIGPYSGSVPLRGPAIVEITADGAWTIAKN